MCGNWKDKYFAASANVSKTNKKKGFFENIKNLPNTSKVKNYICRKIYREILKVAQIF
jgi:hypothetical protein